MEPTIADMTPQTATNKPKATERPPTGDEIELQPAHRMLKLSRRKLRCCRPKRQVRKAPTTHAISKDAELEPNGRTAKDKDRSADTTHSSRDTAAG